MRHYFLITIIFIIFDITFLACDKKTNEKLQETNKAQTTSGIALNSDKQTQRDIGGIDLITDEQFKRDLLEYLAYDAKLDYINIYRYLSKAYLKKYFPNIKNAEEYKKEMENTSEAGPSKYLEITKWRRLKNGEYEVESFFETNAEGNMLKIKALYYFVNEDGKWKFNSQKLVSYLDLESKDKTWKSY